MLTDTLIQQLFASYPSHLGTIAADYKEIQEGFSGAKVLLVDILGSDGAYSGKAYAKIDRSERTTAEFRQHAQARQGMEDHIPAVIHAPMGHVDGFSMVLYQPASEVVWGARSLSRVLDDFAANRLRWDEVAPQIRRLTSEVLAGWQIPKRLTTGRKGYAPRQLLQDVLNRGNDNRFDTLAERFKTHFGIQTTTSLLTFLADVTPPNNAITLPNPLYFALQDGLLPQLTLARTPMHGDLHGGNIICRLGQDGRLADVAPQMLDTALFEPQGLLFFDLAYLELNVMARCLTVKDTADWADWLAILPAMTRFDIRLKGEPPGMRPAATWPLLKAIRDRVADLLEVLEKRSASVAEEYQASWWLAAWAAGLSISRSSHSQPWLRSAALLYAAYSLESLLRMWDIPLGGTPQPLRWDPERLELRAGESSAPLPVAPKVLGRLWEVPSVSEGYLQRLDELTTARGLLLAHATTAVTAVGRDNRVAIQGMGGLGKTVLAAMLCRDEAVRMAFPDGIFWLTFGMQPQIESLMARLASYVEGRATALSDVESLRTLLVTLLGEKRCLLVLDDIWDHQHVRGLLGLGPQVRVLVTTRKQDVVRAVDAAIHTLQMLNNEDARLLLAKSSGVTLEKLPKATAGILKACNGLPLALDMIGRALKGKLLNRWDTMLNRLQNEELPDIPIQSADYNKGYNNLWTVVHVSVAELQEDMGEAVEGCYLDLAVFPDDAQVPESTLVTYWAARGLNVEDVQDLLDSLVDRALLLRETRDENLSLYKPHDLQLDYMRGRVKQSGQGLTALHERLLRAYNPENRPWHQVPDDHYLYLRLAYHLQELGRMDELHRLAVGSPEWRNAKFRACEGDAAYADDLLLLLGRYKDRHPPTADEMLRIAELRAAQQVIAARADRYTDLDLRLLVWYGRLGEALSYARMRRSSATRFKGLLAVRTALLENPRGQNPSEAAAIKRITDELLDSLRDDYGTEFLEDAQTFLLALVQEGQIEAVRAGAESMRAAEARAGAWTQIGSVLTKLASDAAEQAWEYSLAAAHTLRFEGARASALRAIAEARAQAGQVEAAEGIARGIDQAYARASALRAIAEARAQAGQYEAAEGIARGIDQAYERASALMAIAAARAEAGQPERAFEVLGSRELSEFVSALVSWGPGFEAIAEDLSVEVLRVTLPILAWEQEKWLPTAQVLAPRFPQGYALVIGVGQTRDPALSLALTAGDARAISRFLRREAGYGAVRLLTDAQATGDSIRDGMRWLAQQAAEHPEASVIIYYSGHGARLVDGRVFLIPHDTDRRDIAGTALSMSEFEDLLGDIQSQHLSVFLDCCHAGDAALTKDSLGIQFVVPDVHQMRNSRGRVLMASCGEHQYSHILPGHDHSLFTEVLLEQLRQPGEVDLLALWQKLSPEVKQRAREVGKVQTPELNAVGYRGVVLTVNPKA
ncbi:MAG: caspase family protein [Anaerolineae bacterium]|nr:caspase family protein [Anaerolineae bacterium]